MTGTARGTPKEPIDPFEVALVDTARFKGESVIGPISLAIRRRDGKTDPILLVDENSPLHSMFIAHRKAVNEMRERLQAAAPRNPAWYGRVSPQRLTGLAVFIAGRERAAVGDEWRSHLSGQTGAGLSPDRQVREAAGFVVAAIHYRLQDLADLIWRPADAVLRSWALSSFFVFLAMVSVSVVFIRQGGLDALADNLGGVAVVWGAAFGLIHVGRRWRDVKPPERKPRRRRQ